LYKKSFIFLGIIIVFAIGISVFFSSILTADIQKLSVFSENIVANKFSEEVSGLKQKEFKKLGAAFNKMIFDIRNLFEKLEEINLVLEDKVKARTKELDQALTVQKAMTDNLEEAFMVVDKDGFLTPTVSKKTYSLFDGLKKNSNLVDLLRIDIDQEGYKEVMTQIDQNLFDFDQLMDFFPARLEKDEKILDIKYSKLLISDSFHGLIVVATDKTKEVQSKKLFETEKSKVNFIVKCFNNRSLVAGFIKEIKDYIDSIPAMDNLVDMIRAVHSIKGGASTIDLKDLADHCHIMEDQLVEIKAFSAELRKSVHHNLIIFYNQYKNDYKQIIGEEIFGEYNPKVSVDASVLDSLLKSFPNVSSSDILNVIYRPVDDVFDFFKRSLITLAEEKNKLKPEIEIKSDFKALPFNILDQIRVDLTHYSRNIIDHAYKDELNRERLGKNKHLAVKIFVKKIADKKIQIWFVDDGVGIDTDKLVEVAVSKKLLTDAQSTEFSHQEKLDLIFWDTISTADNVTSLSGRGLGMSALQKKVVSLGGTLSIDSDYNKSTSLVLELNLMQEIIA
jgi:HPt (histidine-containing phosphotransfer) domain-containing protein/HAMP domain-containing protein